MTGPDNFLSRWARRKRGAETLSGIPSRDAGPELTAPSHPEAESEPSLDLASLDLTSLDLENLPSVASITETTDIRGFLTSRVPAELTRAALRRVWASDPAIRDFIGIAENQWDFNDPNAIPGFGPLRGTTDTPALLADTLGRLEHVAEAIPGPAIPAEPTPPAVIACRDDLPEQTSRQILPSAGPIVGARGAPNEDAESTAPSSVATVNRDTRPEHRRPHGSALPR
jgi:hypothetical protein